MEVKSNIIKFPFQRVTEAESNNRAQHETELPAQAQNNVVPLPLFGHHKERKSLMCWAAGYSLER